jgi:hypothetical protein
MTVHVAPLEEQSHNSKNAHFEPTGGIPEDRIYLVE